jgi:hypothetical protein
MANESQAIGDGEPSGKRVIYDLYFEEGSRTHQRTDWFLIFHAILLEAFFSEKSRGWAQDVVGSIGLVTSYLWLMAGVRQRWLFMHLGKCMESGQIMGDAAASMYRGVFKAREVGLTWVVRWARPVACFCVITPAAFVIAWAVLLALIELKWRWLGLLLAVAFCVLGSLVASWLGPGPKISERMVQLVAQPPVPLQRAGGTQDEGA